MRIVTNTEFNIGEDVYYMPTCSGCYELCVVEDIEVTKTKQIGEHTPIYVDNDGFNTYIYYSIFLKSDPTCCYYCYETDLIKIK